MDDVVVIDVQAKFTDNTEKGIDKATKSVKKYEKAVKAADKTAEQAAKKKRSITLSLNDNATSGIEKVLKAANKFNGKHYKGTLSFLDKASSVASKVLKSTKSIAGKTFKSTISFIDKASTVIEKASTKLKSVTGKVWRSTLEVVDKFTSPLSKLKNMLFSVQSLITTVAAGLATKLVVKDPVDLADSLTTSQIFFETKLGSKGAADSMMSDIKQFAIETPFETSDIINYTQSLLAMGFEAENALDYLEKFGNTSAALGKGSDGIDSIVRALGQMNMKGKVSAEEMLQLTEAGVDAWGYVAKGVGKSTAEVQEMVSKGLIPVDKAIGYIIDGMSEYDGIMQKTANMTVKGLLSQIKDTFSVKIIEKWGKGLQTGAVTGLKKFSEILGRIDGALNEAGADLEDLGEIVSTSVFDALNGVAEKIENVVNTDEFKNADLGGKIKIIWDEVIWTPFVDWWEQKGKPKLVEKMNELGEELGKGISKGLLAILGIDIESASEDGASVAGSFASGFVDGFDGEAVGTALLEAIKKGLKSGSKGLADLLFPGDQGATDGQKLMGIGLGALGLKSLPTVAKGTKGAIKLGKGIYNTVSEGVSVAKGVKTVDEVGKVGRTIGRIIGSTGNRTVSGTGILGKLADIGFKTKGGAESVKAATTTGTQAAKAGATTLGSALSVIGGLISLGEMGYDAYKGTKKSEEWLGSDSTGKKVASGIGAFFGGTGPGVGETGSKSEKAKNILSGAGKYAGIGGAIGTLIAPGVGTAIGTGVGAVVGAGVSAIGGERIAKGADAAGEALSTFFTETIPQTFGQLKTKLSTFFTETIPEKWDDMWESVDSFFTEKIPYALGYVAGKVTSFFTVTIPEKWEEFLEGVVTFFTDTLPTALETLGTNVYDFLTVTVPTKVQEIWDGIVTFFTDTVPTALETLASKVSEFLTETVPTKVQEIWDGVVTFFTDTVPDALETISKGVTTFFTETIPAKIQEIWDSITGWISEKVGTIWSSITAGYSAGKEDTADKNASGGYIGRKTLSWLAEEGTPEMVIPLGAHRRERAISLWEQTGRILGITPEKNALGGIVGADNNDLTTKPVSFRLNGMGGMQVNIGSITISVNTNGNQNDILAAIKAQKNAIVEVITESLYEALVKEFENMPLAV